MEPRPTQPPASPPAGARSSAPAALAVALAAVAVPAGLIGVFLLGPVIVFDERGGDWRAISEGLRRSPDRRSLAAAERAVVHFHDLRRTPAEIVLLASLLDAAAPLRLTAESGGRVVFELRLASQPSPLRVSVDEETRDVEIFLSADPGADSAGRLYRIGSIALNRRGPLFRLAQALPAAAGLVVLLLLWPRGRRVSAVCWSLAAAVLVAASWICFVDPESLLRLRPATREACVTASVAGLWALALAAAAPRRAAVAALLGTLLLLYGPSLHYGFASDDYLWARPWSWSQLLSTLAGPEDPLGVALGKYRPLPNLLRAADYLLWGVDARGWHSTNLVLHLLNGVAALALLARLGLSPRAALFGALAFVAHPLSASTAAWPTQRTDGLMVLFYLVALFVSLRATLRRSDLAIVAAATALALMSKETAVTLPIVLLLARRSLYRSPDPDARRLFVVSGSIVAGYLLFWAWLFSGQLAVGRALPVPAGLIGKLRLIGALFAPIFLPTGYADWYDRRLGDWPALYFVAALAVAVAPWAVIAACRRCGARARLRVLALLWPPLVVAPMLGVRIVDLYRLGLLPCFAFALTWGVLVAHAEHRAAWLPSALALALGAWLAPLSARTAEAWSPAGFQSSRNLELDRQNPRWLAGLGGEARALFSRQLERRDHARAFTAKP